MAGRTALLMTSLGTILLTVSAHHDSHVPYQVSVEVEDQFVCSGAIITVYWVLTLASCVYSVSPRDVLVRAGSGVPQWKGSLHWVQEVMVHPQYRPKKTLQSNIALLKVYSRISYGSRVRPITLWPRTPSPGSQGWAAGWSCLLDKEPLRDRHSSKLHVIVLQPDTCIVPTNNSRLICVSETSHLSSTKCLREGALLVVRKRLAGFNLLRLNYAFSIFVAVGPHIAWIKQAAFGIP